MKGDLSGLFIFVSVLILVGSHQVRDILSELIEAFKQYKINRHAK